MSSETGVVDIEPKNIKSHRELEPGKMFLVDMNRGRIVEDEEIKNQIVNKYPKKWVDENVLRLKRRSIHWK